MADSLVLANLFELLGGGVPSDLPMCAGAVFRLGNQYDMGGPQPIVNFVTQLMGDGSRPTGGRYDNRTFTLPITIVVPTTGNYFGDRLTLAGAREALLQAISADHFDMVWAPDGTEGALNTIYECWEAKASAVNWDIKQTKQLISELTVTFDAMPFGRSDALSSLSFDSPVSGVPAPVTPVLLDDFTTPYSSTNPSLWTGAIATPYGNQSAEWLHRSSDDLTPLKYTGSIFGQQTQGFESGLGNFTATGNCSIAITSAQKHAGAQAMALTSLASGNMSAGSSLAGSVEANGLTVAPGDAVVLSAWFRAAVSARSVQVGAEFYDITGTSIATTFGSTVTDSTSAWTQATASLTAPASAAFFRLRTQVVSTGAANEVHYVDDTSMSSGTAANITGCNKLTFWLGLGADTTQAFRGWKKGLVHFQATLTDIDGTTITLGVQQQCRCASKYTWPVWNRVSMLIPQGSAGFDYTQVAGYSIKAWTDVHTRHDGKHLELRHTGYLAGLFAAPTPAPRRPASDRGGEYVLYGVEGTAPTPLNLHLQLGFQSLVPVTQTLLLPGQPGVPQTYVAPAENPNWLYGDSADGEKGTTGTWTGSDGAATNGTLANSNTVAHGGTQSIRVTPVTGGSNVLIASTPASNITVAGVPCVAGDRIGLRCWVRAGSTSRSITLAAEFFNSGGASIGTQSLGAVADSSSAWTALGGRVTAPSNAAYARMLITIPTPAVGEFHYFDDLYLSWAVQATVVCVGAGGAGGSCKPNWTAGAGGSAGEIAWETQMDLNPGAAHAYTIGAGGQPNYTGSRGGDGGDSTFAGLSVTVLANGGLGGPNTLTADNTQSSGSGVTSGSTNTHHFNGGNGGNGNHQLNGWPTGGGGGGSAGDGGAGAVGGTPSGGQGGAAGSLSIGGGQGGAGQNNHGGAGFPGVFPGGGGGGGSCQVFQHPGAAGANGLIKVIITTYVSKQTFPTVLVHKLSDRSNIRARAVVPVGAGQDAPDGREYAIDLADGLPARYKGTYSVAAVNFSWNGSAARTITGTIRQYEASGGAVSSFALAQSVTPANVQGGMVWLGEVTLPLKDMPDENTDSYFTVALNSGNSSDRFLDLLLVDTSGQVILVTLPGSGYTDYYFDAPDLRSQIGMVLGSMSDRSAAVSVSANTFMSGGPMRLTPGDNVFTVYSPTGMPALEGDYWPRWWHERLS